MSERELYSYVSTRAGADPVRTIFLCAPDEQATTVERARRFAEASGWVDEVEADGDLLVVPVVPSGWEDASPDLLRELYQRHRNAFRAPSHVSIPGREGVVWTWESLIYVAGYEEGATHAANLMVAHPGFAAAYALVGGTASDWSREHAPSDHWFVPEPSAEGRRSNDEIAVAAWLFGSAAADERLKSRIASAASPKWALRCFTGLRGSDPAIAGVAMRDLFCHVVRWKDSPDGTLAKRPSRREFFYGDRFAHGSVETAQNSYHYAVHLPQGMGPGDVAGLALVVSLHGRGEPTWLFADKNGWEELADETRAFVVVQVDSPNNVWVLDRDDGVPGMVAERLVGEYALDRDRVYLTGFSNGAAFTCQQASLHPEAFAAASPWNCPPAAAIAGSGMGDFILSPSLAGSGYELPLFVVAGDSDAKAPRGEGVDLAYALRANACAAEPAATDTLGRLTINRYADSAGHELVDEVVVRDMPHGAIAAEAQASWEFMSRFRRKGGSKNVEEVEA